MNKLVILFMIHFGVVFSSKEEGLLNAAFDDNLSLLTDLLASGVNPNCRQTPGQWTALHAAAYKNHVVAVKVLLIAGADKDLQDSDGRTPLFMAAWLGNFAAAETLIQYGADADIPSLNSRLTPLMMAIEFDHPNIARILITAPQANLDIQDKLGQTALYQAVSKNMASTVELLLQNGANPSIRDKGMTPAELARDKGYDQLARSIESYKWAITSTGKTTDKRLEL